MTNIFERRIRRLEARTPAAGQNVIFLGLPRQSDPNSASIGSGDLVIRVCFVGSCDGRLVEETAHAHH